MPRSDDRQRSTGVSFVKIAGDRRSTEAHCAHGKHCGDGESQHGAVAMRLGPDHRDDDQNPAHEGACDYPWPCEAFAR